MIIRSVYILFALRICCIRVLFTTSLSQLFLLRVSSLLEKRERTNNNNDNNGIYIALIHRCSKRFTMYFTTYALLLYIQRTTFPNKAK